MDPIVQQPKKSFGPMIGIILIIIVLVVGALYFWGQKLVSTNSTGTSMEQSNLKSSEPVSKSDDVDSLEADLNTTNTAGVDFSGVDSAQ